MIAIRNVLLVSLLAGSMAVAEDRKSDEWRTKLQSIIRQHHADAVVTVENGAYVYRYHTQTFKIHTIYKTGEIAATAHDEEGPNVDGVFLTVSLQDGPYQGAAEIPQDLRRPYWTTFINSYPFATGKHLWMSLSYGSRSDKKLIEAIKTCFGPVVPPKPGTINQPLEKAQPAHESNNPKAISTTRIPVMAGCGAKCRVRATCLRGAQ